MRARSLIAIAVLSLTGLYAVAVSRPGTEPESTAAGTSTREINLAGDSLQDAAVVSPLEAGRPGGQVVGRTVARSEGRTGGRAVIEEPVAEATPEASHVHHALTAIDLAPQVRTAAATAELSTSLDYAPIAATTPNLPAATGTVALGPESRGVQPSYDMPGRGRGPVILIRGGNGTGHDDCKIHPNGLQRPAVGTAVNRLTPVLGGGVVGTSAPGGWRGGGIR